MLRALFLALLVLAGSREASSQAPGILHIKVVIVDAAQNPTPVPRHLLLISDNPSSAPPRRIFTAVDGTVDVTLPPGNYTVESDRPVAFHGKAYQWTQFIDIVAGRDAVLELTADNADDESFVSAPASARPLEADPAFLLPRWQDSVVAIWTPTAHASGFVIDARGLIATNQRGIGTATAIEVQLTQRLKVAARVLMSDAARDVAILWIDPAAVASLRPMPLECAPTAKTAIVSGQELYTIGVPLREPKGMTAGTVRRVEAQTIAADLMVAPGSTGGPVFAAAGSVVGITSPVNDKEQADRGAARVVRVERLCEAVASVETKMKAAPPPDPAHLPVEPSRPFPRTALQDAAKGRAGSVNPYQLSASDFDVAFITPVHTYAGQYQAEQMKKPASATPSRMPVVEPAIERPLMDFGNWSDYVADFPPLLLIRITPKLVEGFWTTVGRHAARTQGVALPPFKHVKAGFSRLRTFCGDAEVTPIHPFRIEQRVSDSEAIYEGLYVFGPDALGPHCGTVKLVLYSEKSPEKADERVVDPKVIQDLWQLFAPARTP